MSESEKVQLPWSDIDTLLLDMDGTLLDLAFDNYFWLELVPGAYAEARGLPLDEAREVVKARYAPVVGTLPWYCLDHWTGELGLDLATMKRAHSHRIRYLPQAEAFLAAARKLDKRLILVTNAHRVTLTIKCDQTGIDGWMDAVVSSHDYGIEKEHVEFWQSLEQEQQIAPERCLLIEDSLAVLETAESYGIAHTVAISHPDTSQEPREIERFTSVAGVRSLIP
jgi:putative hydrolase of the HAD superfamily